MGYRFASMQARCKLDARWPGTSTTISTYFFSGEVGIERQGCLASLLGQPPALLLLFLVCLVFSLCIPPSPRVSRRGYPEVYRRRETEAVKAAARPAAASVSLHHARDLVLPRASSISGVASPPRLSTLRLGGPCSCRQSSPEDSANRSRRPDASPTRVR